MITPLGIDKRIKVLKLEGTTNDTEVRKVYTDAIAQLNKIKLDRLETK